MQKIGTETYQVHTYEVDALGRMCLPVLASLLQESASRHANQLGWGYASLIKKNCIWVLTALKIEMDTDPGWNDRLIIETWPSGKNRFFYYRDFNIKNEAHELLGRATTTWIIINIQNRKPARPEIPEPFDFSELHSLFAEPPRKWMVSDNLSLIETIRVRFDDLDINNHVNNIQYIDWMMRSLDSKYRRTHRLKTFEIHFLSEATEGNCVQVYLRQDDHEFQHVLKHEQDGKSIAQSHSVWEPVRSGTSEGECCIKKRLADKGMI